jgi:hypothetical protein
VLKANVGSKLASATDNLKSELRNGNEKLA